jgi:hypothetical protein
MKGASSLEPSTLAQAEAAASMPKGLRRLRPERIKQEIVDEVHQRPAADGPQHAVVDHHELGHVLQHDGDAVARPDAAVLQKPGPRALRSSSAR